MNALISCFYVMVGGGIGSVMRHLMGLSMSSLSRHFPLGTLCINILASFLIAFFGTLTLEEGYFPASENLRLFFMVGVCGGFSTVSSFSLQTLELWRAGSMEKALLNIFLTASLSMAGVCLGFLAAAYLNNVLKG
ncbi:fluoride efflux transporter CrcB [Acetobacteraceae bacterium]|nr:fluoride efflux transporter CrcB [Acetobacteraceae bacterium]